MTDTNTLTPTDAMPEPHYGKGRYLGFARYNDAYSVAQVQAMLAAKTQPTTEYTNEPTSLPQPLP